MLRCDDRPMHEVTTATDVRSDQATRHMGVCTASPSGALAQETRAAPRGKYPLWAKAAATAGAGTEEAGTPGERAPPQGPGRARAGKRLWPPTGWWGATERAVRSARTSARTSPGDAGRDLTSCCDAERECA
jgi:hypothetical protein